MGGVSGWGGLGGPPELRPHRSSKDKTPPDSLAGSFHVETCEARREPIPVYATAQEFHVSKTKRLKAKKKRGSAVTDEEKKAGESSSGLTVTTGMLTTFILANLFGHHEAANQVLAASGVLLAHSKEMHQSNFLQKAQGALGAVPVLRIGSLFQRAGQRVQEEQIEVDPVRMVDLLQTAARYVGDAETEDKRRMMEEVILNGARKSKGTAGQIEAMEVLAVIGDMPDSAVLVFAEIVRLTKQIPPSQKPVLFKPVPDCGLPSRIYLDALKYLSGKFHSAAGRIPIQIEDRPGFIESIVEGRGEIFSSNGSGEYYLTSYGKWIADWITSNPANPSTEEATEPA